MFITIKKEKLLKNIFILLTIIISIYLLFLYFKTNIKKQKITISTNQNNSIISTSNINNKQENNNISYKTIILDAGHGLPDGGATSNLDSNIIESDLNLKVVLKLQKLLLSSNINVILTRSDENGIYNETADTIRKKKISDMENRVNLSNTSEANLFISIHMNKLDNPSVKGFQVFYSNTNSNLDISKKCASYIDQNLKNTINETNTSKNIKEISNIYLTNHLKIPLVLIECGFLSNNEETILLTSDEYQEKLAFAIYTGIMDYLNSY